MSHASSATQPPPSNSNDPTQAQDFSLWSLLAARAPTDPNAPLLMHPDGDVHSYADVFTQAERIHTIFHKAGARVGDRIAARVEKSETALAVYLACLRGGFVFLPMNTAYRGDEVAYLLDNAEPRVVVCQPRDAQETLALLALTQALGEGGPDDTVPLFTLDQDGSGSLAEALLDLEKQDHTDQLTPPHPTLGADAPAAMLYTSGTTGKPKGAVLTQRNLASNGLALRDYWRFTGEDVLIHALPIFHAHGLFVACHTVLLAGGSMIWLNSFDPDLVIDCLPRATSFMGVPTFYTRLLGHPGFTKDSCRGMRLFVSGSAPLLAETHREFSERTGHAILERYGMTETVMNSSNPYDGDRIPGSVGFPLPGIALRVCDESDAELPVDTVGALQVRGPNVMSGYWRLPEKTAEEFTADGWFRTGDIARIDERGYIYIVGRAKDLIISGGYNVYPKEVEGVIDDLPYVLESAVVGVPHKDFGEVGVAVVVIRPEATVDPDSVPGDVIETCKEHLANYKVPKRVVIEPSLPRNTMGKVQKAALRERYG